MGNHGMIFPMRRSALISFAALIVLGVGCDAPKLTVEDAVEKAAEQVQSAVQEATERGAEEVAKRQTGQDVDIDFTHSGATIVDPATGKTVSVGAAVSIPAGFPSDIPVYPGATPTSLSLDPNKTDASLLLITKDGRNAIRDWYNAQAATAGWETDGALETADQVLLSFKKDGAKLTVTVLPPNLQKETGILLLRKGE